MRKYKNKFLLALALAFVFVVAFSITSFALEGEDISITYDSSPGFESLSFSPTSAVGGEEVTLPNIKEGEASLTEGCTFLWVANDGGAYVGGATVIFYEDVTLTPIIAYDVSTAEEFYDICSKFDDSAFEGLTPTQLGSKSITERYIYIRLLDDIKLTKATPVKTSVGSWLNIVLNGQALTIDKSLDCALGGANFGTRLYGNGTVKYEGTGALVCLDSKSGTEVKNTLFVGANVYIDAPNATLGKDKSDQTNAAYPRVDIYGTVSCKTLLEVSNSKNRSPVVSIHTPAFLKIFGNTVVSAKDANGAGNKFTINIDGGTIVAETDGISFFADENATYNITGGSFTFPKANANDFTLLKTYAKEKGATVSSKFADGYSSVFDKKCDHKFPSEPVVYSANCQHEKQEVYKCTLCDAVFYFTSGTRTDHEFDSTKTTVTDPTPTKLGEIIKRCKHCASEEYTFVPYNPLKDKISIVVQTDEGKKTISKTVEELFEIDNDYIINGIKDFGDYKASQVIEMTIPAGIKGINIKTENTTFEKLIFANDADIEIISLVNFKGLKTIEINDASHVRFFANCAPDSLTSVKSLKVNAKVTFYDNAFAGKGNLSELVLTGLSEYSFGAFSFKGTGIKTLELSDNAIVTFTGDNTFQDSKLEYLYVGKGIKSIVSKPFVSAKQLKKIILMDVTSISDGAFSELSDGCVIYHHASKLELGENTFAKNKDITLYTTASITKGFKDCTNFTIVKNIMHALKEEKKEATCTENGYTKYKNVDCPCGKDEGTEADVYVNVYTNEKATEKRDYTNKTSPKTEHIPGDIPVIRYFNGYTKEGYYIKECVDCKTALTESAVVCAPLVKSLGFSVSEDNNGGAMTVKYVMNASILKEISTILGSDFECGTIIGIREALGDKTPLNDDGSARNGVIKIDTTKQNYASLLLKLTSLNEKQQSFSFIMCTYIIEKGEISYIQDNEIVKNPSGVSYKEVKELADFMEMMQTPVPASDEE